MSANTYGRQVVVPLTNKSGGGVVAGDVVIVDTSNNVAFTTTTSAGVTGGVGIAQETIASNAVGRVLTQGYAALVNVNASVTRGNYGATHTVAKQAAGQASRGTGTFCQFLTGGTTPDALVFPVDLLGTSLTNPMSAVGDIIQGTTAGAPARLASPLAGKVLTGAGLTTTLAWVYPPGYEVDYVEITGNASITATSFATANTFITGNAVTFDGAPVMVEVYAPFVGVTTLVCYIVLFIDGTNAGRFGEVYSASASAIEVPVRLATRITPAAGSHTLTIRAYVNTGTATIAAGAGGTTNTMPAFYRVTKV